MKIAYAVLILGLTQNLFAQTDTNYFNSNFDKNFNTIQSRSNLFSVFKNDNFSFLIDDKFSSAKIKSISPISRSENKLNFVSSYKISDKTNLQFLGESFLLADNQNLISQQTGWHSVYFGSNFIPAKEVVITPLIGFRTEKQFNEINSGAAGRLNFKTEAIEIIGGNLRTSFDISSGNLLPRIFWNKIAETSFNKKFGEAAFDSLNFKWGSNRWDFYFPADKDIEKEFGKNLNIRERIENKSAVHQSLNYKVSDRLSTNFNFIFNNEKISNSFRYKANLQTSPTIFDTEVERNELGMETKFDFNTSTSKSNFILRYNEKTELHQIIKPNSANKNLIEQRQKQESRLNNLARVTFISTTTEKIFSPKTILWFATGSQILHYDTPDSLNIEDRDELSTDISFKISHAFSSAIKITIASDLILYHLVYLNSERSANNNWNRLLRFWMQSSSNGEDFRSTTKGEVLANFTVFDFESISPNVKSYIYREMNLSDSTSIKIKNNFWINIFANVRFYERGDLKWKEFKERPIQYFEELTFAPNISYKTREDLNVYFGLRSFIQTRFNFTDLKKIKDSDFKTYGPTTGLVWNLNEKYFFQMRFWQENQKSSEGFNQTINNGSLEIKFRF